MCGLAVDFDLIRLLVDLLVVFDVRVDRGPIVSVRHIETLFQLNVAYRVDPDGHVSTVIANGGILGDQIQLGCLDALDRLVPQVRCETQ